MAEPAITCRDIEIAVAAIFNYRSNIIVPNVSWGLFPALRYEADLVVLRPSGYGVEVEIKVSAGDIKADTKKRHNHDCVLFRELWFAVPESLSGHADIPARAGIISVYWNDWSGRWSAKKKRPPKINKYAVRFSDSQMLKLLHLGCMRVWSLKRHAAKPKEE